jgi:hypothetical protein
MDVGLYAKFLSFLSDFRQTLILWRDFRKILKINSWKSDQWEPSFSTRNDGQRETGKQADVTKLLVAFRSYVTRAYKKQ